jgi:protein involved in polysaccharide export with SLBB domain
MRKIFITAPKTETSRGAVRQGGNFPTVIAVAVFCTLGIAACSPQTAAPTPLAATDTQPGRAAIDGTAGLWNARTADTAPNKNFAIGPGDVITVSVPRIDELKDAQARVSEDGTIALPMLGEMTVAGMSEEELRQAVADHLRKYVYHPDVSVFVTEYHSRQVAVIGSVQKPGLYTLSSRTGTVLEMISEAGGMTPDAAERVIIVPDGLYKGNTADFVQASVAKPASQDALTTPRQGKPNGPDSETAIAPEGPAHVMNVSVGAEGSNYIGILQHATDPVVVDLNDTDRNNHLTMPARPGDVIIVPASGNVMVQGWVATPGAYKIVPGMTVLSSVAAAGGELFSDQAKLIRTTPDGQRVELMEDLAKAKKAEEPDLPVHSGDVVVINRSVLGALPYSAYFLFQHFNTGIPIVY